MHKPIPHTAAAALLLVGDNCPHCAQQQQSLEELLKRRVLAKIEVINVNRYPDIALRLGVRSVPWLRLGEFELSGLQTQAELRRWASLCGTDAGRVTYLSELLERGGLAKAIHYIRREPERATALVELLGDPTLNLQIRLGCAAVLESFENSDILRQLTRSLIKLTEHNDARIRADACYMLGLGRDPAARVHLEACQTDPDPDVREIVQDSLKAW